MGIDSINTPNVVQTTSNLVEPSIRPFFWLLASSNNKIAAGLSLSVSLSCSLAMPHTHAGKRAAVRSYILFEQRTNFLIPCVWICQMCVNMRRERRERENPFVSCCCPAEKVVGPADTTLVLPYAYYYCCMHMKKIPLHEFDPQRPDAWLYLQYYLPVCGCTTVCLRFVCCPGCVCLCHVLHINL